MHTGLRLNSFKHLCKNGMIKIMPAPDRVTLSLHQHADATLYPCVQQGDLVTLGQVIAKPHAAHSAWLHASVSGTIHSISDRYIVIQNDHKERISDFGVSNTEWREWSPQELIAHLAQGGIAGLGGAAYSTAAKLSAHRKDAIETLIINGMECEPFITCDDWLMREHAASILKGVQILLHASDAQRALIAIEDDKPVAIESMRNALKGVDASRIEIRVLPAAYPNGDEGQLIRLLLHKEIPRGYLPSTLGVLVHNVATAHACAQWINASQPLIGRVVTITGHGVHEPANVDVCIGTAYKDIVAFCGGYQNKIISLISGGAMMGRALHSDDEVITKTSNCLIAATAMDIAPHYDEQPCIRCGECAHACPANLLPQQLLMHLRNQNVPTALELGLRDCIECGCCDAVCPSHIALASRFHTAKLQLME